MLDFEHTSNSVVTVFEQKKTLAGLDNYVLKV